MVDYNIADPSDTLNALAGGLKFGQQVRQIQDQNKVNALAGQLYQNPDQQQQILGQVASIDPRAAGQLGAQADQFQDRQQAMMVNGARLLASAPEQYKAQVYQQLKPGLSKIIPNLPEQYDQTVADAANSIVQAYGGTAAQGQPAGFQQFQLTAQAAGLKPGTPEYQQAARIALGQEGRASNAGFTLVKFDGPDARPRVGSFDGRTGRIVMPDGTSFDPSQVANVVDANSGTPLGAPVPAAPQQPSQAPAPSGNAGGDFSILAQNFPGATMTSGYRTAGHNREVGGVGNSQHLDGTASDWVIPQNQKQAFINTAKQLGYKAIEEGDHVHIQRLQGGGASNNPGAFVGRSPEDTAAAVEQAKTDVQIANMPTINSLEAEGAAAKAAAEARVKREADLASAAQKKYVDASTTLGLLDEAEDLIKNSTGSRAGALYDAGAALFGQSTEGAQAIAKLQPVAANLTLAVPRMEGPQSDADRLLYQKAAGDFANDTVPRETRLAALAQMRRLANKYKNLGPSPNQTASAPSGGDFSNLWK